VHKIFANTLFIGKQYVSLPSCHSTNDMLMQMADEKLVFEGTVLKADAQTRGKGQRGNTWLSEPSKNLTCSILLKPKFLKPQQQFDLNRIISLGILEALQKYLPHETIEVKWPNDIYVNRQKIAGILIENTLSSQAITQSIVGIGLNVNQFDQLPDGATSVLKASGLVFEIEEILEEIIHQIEKYYLMLKSGERLIVDQSYIDHLFQFQQMANYEDADGAFRGTIKGVSKDGLLLIAKSTGKECSYQFKEVTFKR
jgi:BirA family biotin operon repressor/biotin-[acetyl-CoA-carboxylase] ligase